MYRIVYISAFGVLSFAFSLELVTAAFLPPRTLALSPIHQQQVNRKNVFEIAAYKPPKGLGAPPTVGAGSRGGNCEQDQTISASPLMALKPDSSLADGWGLTVAAQPEFLVYIPQTSVKDAEFVLKDENENDIYRTNVRITGSPGIIDINFQKTSVKLELGKSYHWYFSMICNPKNRRRDVTVYGWSQRVEPPANLAAQLQGATPLQRSQLYAEAGIWHEAVATLAETLSKNPNDPALLTEWKQLLESAGLKQIANLPFTFTRAQESP